MFKKCSVHLEIMVNGFSVLSMKCISEHNYLKNYKCIPGIHTGGRQSVDSYTTSYRERGSEKTAKKMCMYLIDDPELIINKVCFSNNFLKPLVR